MRKIILTAEGEMLTGHLPESWAEVPLGGYVTLAAAEGLPARIEAAARLLSLPPAPLLEDVSLFAVIAAKAPWLFGDELPADDLPVVYFTHQGVTYQHQGDLHKINAGQLEALLTFLREQQGHPLSCAPHLLAVLYCPAGQAQTPAVVQAASQALAALPMSIAWPALGSFTRNSGKRALSIRTVSALRAQVENLVKELEATMDSASSTFFSRLPRFLTRLWLRNVKRLL